MAVPSVVAIIVVTVFFGIACFLGMFFSRKGADKGLYQTMVITTCLCLWLFWLCAYLAQINPIVAPQIKASEYCLRDQDNNTIC